MRNVNNLQREAQENVARGGNLHLRKKLQREIIRITSFAIFFCFLHQRQSLT